jgi:N-acetylmuramic acid 6-phosphate etherase
MHHFWQMVDLVASNAKLKQRSRNILRQLSKSCSTISDASLDGLLQRCNHNVKLALLVSESGRPVDKCRRRLEMAEGVLTTALARLAVETRTKVPIEGHRHTNQQREYVLCVDGGGSKCAAVIANRMGIVSRGFAGPSNMFVADTSLHTKLF